MSNKVNTSLAYVPFSEHRVVAKLIKERSKCDASYYASVETPGILSSDGSYGIDEDALCIYADLDSLIERAGLSEQEHLTVDYLMQGYIITDIAEHFGKSRQNFEILFGRAVEKIVSRNNADWEECTGGRLDDQ